MKRPSRSYNGVTAEQRIAERRARLVEAAFDEYGTRGYLVTGVKDICRRAGLTDRYFYESFRDGGELFMAAFDHATSVLLDVVITAIAEAPKDQRAQAYAVIEAYVRALADDPRLARIVFIEAPSAGARAEEHMRTTLRQFARLVEMTARNYLPDSVTNDVLRFGSIALVGAIERLMIEWQDGELGLSIDQIIQYLSEMLISAGEVASLSTRPARKPRRSPK
jgi:AcrR family transcriptional regulator